MANKVILSLRGITKRFGGLTALDSVDMDLYENEILALVGDNGAGKSTLIKIISGAYMPDNGEVYLYDQKVNFNSPHDAKKHGIETVYQDLALVDTLDVSNNLFLGKEVTVSIFGKIFNVLKHKTMENESKKIIKTLGINIPNIRQKVKFLSGGQRQCVAVARASAFGKKIVLLDEPTAALGVEEASHVLNIAKNLKNKGISVIIITHNLEHAFLVADRFYVLRLGKKAGEKNKSETDIDEIVKIITGGVLV